MTEKFHLRLYMSFSIELQFCKMYCKTIKDSIPGKKAIFQKIKSKQ